MAVNLLGGLFVISSYCSLPVPFVQQFTLDYQVPEENETLRQLVTLYLISSLD